MNEVTTGGVSADRMTVKALKQEMLARGVGLEVVLMVCRPNDSQGIETGDPDKDGKVAEVFESADRMTIKALKLSNGRSD